MNKEEIKIIEIRKKELLKDIKNQVNTKKNSWKKWELIFEFQKKIDIKKKDLLIKTHNKSESIDLIAFIYLKEKNSVEILVKFKEHKNFFYKKGIKTLLINKLLDKTVYPELLFKVNRRLKKLSIL